MIRSLINCLTFLITLKLTTELVCHASIAENYQIVRSYNRSALLAINDEWKWRYVDENVPGFKKILEENSLDERLANIVYTSNSVKLSNICDFKFNLGTDELNQNAINSTAGPKVDNELCGTHLSQMLALIEELETIVERKRNNDRSAKLEEKHFRLSQIMDSFGRYEAGLLSGKQMFLGSYPQCIGTNMMLDSNNTTISSRYCYARLRIDRQLNPSLSLAKLNLEQETDNLLTTAICIPESCHTLSFEKHKQLFSKLVNYHFRLPKNIFMDETLELDSIYCLPDKGSERFKIPFEGKLLITFLTCLIASTILATCICESKQQTITTKGQQNSIGWRILRAISLKKQWEDFIVSGKSQRYADDKRVNLETLNPIKVFGSAFVVVGHCWIIKLVSSADMLRILKDVESRSLVYLSMGGTNVVDSFFVITGLILTYIALKKFHKSEEKKKLTTKSPKATLSTEILENSKRTFEIILMRYLRLMPLLFITFWFKRTIFLNFDLGQLSDTTYNSRIGFGVCRKESWLVPLTLTVGFLPMSNSCLVQTWSVGCDMFFAIILAPIITLMVKRPKLAMTLAIIISVLSTTMMTYDFSGIHPNLSESLSTLRFYAFIRFFRDAGHLYTYPHYRVFSAILGSLAGYILFNYNRSDRDWPQWFKSYATNISIATIIILLGAFGVIPTLRENNLLGSGPWAKYAFNFGMSGLRLFWSASNAILFMRMTTDWKDKFWFSSGKFWNIMAKLNYALLLVHFDLLFYFLSNRNNIEYLSHSRYLVDALGIYTLSLVLAGFVYLFIESPINNIVKIFREKKSPQTKGEPTSRILYDYKGNDGNNIVGLLNNLGDSGLVKVLR